jgi:phosphatidylinositol glycan class A protein
VDRCICVSYTSKENTHHRTKIPLGKIHVIPNAVVSENFPQREYIRDRNIITVIVVSRLVYRKGVDILIKVIPKLCKSNSRIRMIIVGDGPKRDELEQAIDEHSLRERIETLGEIKHGDVGKVLRMGDIFLNTSLTETFCMAILEAASSGLMVVSTNVGGIHEILPESMIVLTSINPDHIVRSILKSIKRIDQHNPTDLHNMVKNSYSWRRVANETEDVYISITLPNRGVSKDTELYNKPGEVLFKLMILIDFVLLKIFDRYF